MMRQIYIYIIIIFFLFPRINSFSQITDTSAKVVFSGYVDAYSAFYTDSVGINNFQKFPSVDPRSKAIGLNTAMITAQYDADKVRGIVSLHFGDIAQCSWPSDFNAVMEAHAGIRLMKKLWIDAGFFRAHTGTEGLLPKENIATSVSVNTFHEPFFESGIRLNFIPSNKLFINFYILNGYNLYIDNNEKKSFGVLAVYTLGENRSIGYNNYIGDDSPQTDTVSHLRIHQNLFFNYQIKKFKFQTGGDLCIQENSDLMENNKSASMYSGILSVKYQAKEKFAVYTRGEIFDDPQGYMSGIVVNGAGLKIFGVTIGVEYKPTENSYVRLEGRELIADKKQEIFRYDGRIKNYRTEVLFNIGVSF